MIKRAVLNEITDLYDELQEIEVDIEELHEAGRILIENAARAEFTMQVYKDGNGEIERKTIKVDPFYVPNFGMLDKILMPEIAQIPELQIVIPTKLSMSFIDTIIYAKKERKIAINIRLIALVNPGPIATS